MMARARDAWQRLYSKHGLQYGGSGDIGPLAHVLRSDMLALDAGCGDGKTTEALARRCAVVGCDFSREALLSLRSQRDSERKVNLVECNIVNLPFVSEKFDAISCVHTLSHVLGPERKRAAEELVRALRSDGHLLVEGFGMSDLRYGEGEEVEHSTFLRGNGILTHYFDEGEIPGLFSSLELVSEVSTRRRVSFGVVAGKRETVRVLMHKA